MEKFNNKYIIAKSKIHGNGIIANKNILKDTKIETAIINKYITPYFGRKINHCELNNNTYLKKEGNSYYIYAKRNIMKGEELTVDYNNTPAFIKKPKNNFKIC